MQFSEQWLREWVNPNLDTAALCEQLSMAGLEVDDVSPAAAAFSNVVVAEVQSVDPHPDADKLRVCQVNVGKELLQIVCGAANVAPGMRTALARIGAELPNGMQIKAAKLRGVASSGMLCSAVELGMADQSDGLIELPADAPVATDIREYLKLDDQIIDIDLTPNRGDCLSILGVAREVAALNNLPLQQPEPAPVEAVHDGDRAVSIEYAEGCSHYLGRVIKAVNSQAATPLWMVERLRRSGIRAIHPVVDVTNYVLVELGQPMHAFDQARLSGDIRVRLAQAGEKLEALTGESLELSGDEMVIADETGPIALAGIVGGAGTAVNAESVDIFLESACFQPKAMAGAARHHKLHTDSSHRFERGVDPTQQQRAIERATALILQICGGEPGPIVQAGKAESRNAAVLLRQARANRLLGFDMTAEQIEQALRGLDMQLESDGAGQWQVTPPSYRYDISIEADLIEELVRVVGYDKLPSRPQEVVLPSVQMTEQQVTVSRLRECLIQRDYHEAVSYSFVDPSKQSELLPESGAIGLDNPIASHLAQMRTSLWSSLLPVLLHNQQRQQHRVRLFEIGLRFMREDQQDIRQQPMLAGIVSGPLFQEQWDAENRKADFFDVKADVETLLGLGGLSESVEYIAATHSALHPGQSAGIQRQGKTIGCIGVLHPRLLPVYDLETAPILFELELAELTRAQLPVHENASDFPAMRRDLALVVEEDITAAALLQTVEEAREALLMEVQLFDVYRGKGLPSGCKSVALSLNFQDKSRTLREDEVEEAVKRLESRLREALGATIRG